MRAYAPGSITGLFAPAEETDASYGASFAVEDGVVVSVRSADRSSVTIDGTETSFEPVTGVLSRLDVTATVDIQLEVPLGNGFGASGAATLATALAANETFDLGRSRDELVGAAHRAELDAGTGQGDVFIQERGGVLWSAGEEIHRREPQLTIEYASGGGIDTKELLDDDTFLEEARRYGLKQLEGLGETPCVTDIVSRSRTFVRELDLTTPYVRRELDRVESAGGTGSMALFGETVFAVGVEDVLPNRTTISNEGARLIDGDGR
ncbi:MAG: GHMP kinase [Natronomonas sp.]